MLTVVVIFYLGLSLLVGVFLSRRVKKASDFLIAGRKLGLLLTTATLSAVQIGAGVILGGAEMGAGKGISNEQTSLIFESNLLSYLSRLCFTASHGTAERERIVRSFHGTTCCTHIPC
jgi:Na+/proline symporter